MPEVLPAIIGAGPIGLEVAWALKQEGIDALHIDAGEIGSTIGWWAPGTRFFSSPERISICGVPLMTPTQDKATREEYLTYLRGVAGQFDLRVRTFERVLSVETKRQRNGETKPEGALLFRLRTRSRSGREFVHEATHVVFAIGDMHRPRLVSIPGEDLPHVSHYLQDPHLYFGRRVLIVGGKNSAVEAAIRLHRVGARVTLSYRKAEFDEVRIKYWLLPEIKGLIKAGRIRFEGRTAPASISQSGARLARLDERGEPAGEELEVEADSVLLLTGYEMDGSLLSNAGVELTGLQNAPVFDPRTMETNVTGLYVAGTATAGTQRRFRVFIENCHDHGARIAAHITGKEAPEPSPSAAIQSLES
jgi:thioredoxin reductase (NADPH)